MIFLKENNVLGQLVVQDVLLYYDGPRLFIAENAAGQKFLINCLSSVGTEETWLVSAISDRRLFALKDGNFELRDVFVKPELGYLLQIVTIASGDLQASLIRTPEQLHDDDLPESGVLIHVHSPDQFAVNAAFLARTLNANIVLLRLYPQQARTEAPAKQVGKILSSFQDYISSKVMRAAQSATAVGQGAIEKLRPSVQVNMIGTFAGSFGLEIAIRGEELPIGATLKSAIDDLNTAEEIEMFRERMAGTDDDEASALKKFIKGVADADTDLLLEAASAGDSEPRTVAVPLLKLREVVKALHRAPKIRTITRTLEVALVGLNLRTRKFEVVEIKTEVRIVGVMAAPIFNELEKAELPSRYRVVLEADVRRSDLGEDEPSAWKMISATRLK